jgi:predicted O-methyltransferase YrrM
MLHLRPESMGNQLQEDTSTPIAEKTRQLDSPGQILKYCISSSKSRLELWFEFIQSSGVRQMAEIGVYRGDFTAFMLQRCPGLTRYYMVDPWRHLSDWNKPSNKANPELEEFFQEAKTKTDFAAAKRVILRGKTTEVIDQIADGELDFAYIDADHTLKGIAIDLIRVYPKVRNGGFLGGDDFTRSVWEHNTRFEPTLVFPFAVYFAEAVGATIYALPYSQFCLQKTSSSQFAFVDLTGHYDDVGLQTQFAPEKLLKLAAGERFPRLLRVARKIRGLLPG